MNAEQPHREQEALFPMSQQSKSRDDIWTPAWIFDALGLEFDLDVACPPEGPAHTPARAFYTQETDGLSSPWWGTVWMNPPYSKPAPWVAKFLDHGDGVALTVVSKSRWMDRAWAEADGFILLGQDMHFVQGRIPYPIILWAAGEKCREALWRSGLGRVR